MRVYHTVPITPADAREARRVATDVFARAGIRLAWRDCTVKRRRPSTAPCDDQLAPREVTVRLVKAPLTQSGPLRDGVLGYAHVDLAAGRGVLATLLVDRIRAIAPAFRLDPGTLLGYALVHEVAHLVLGTPAHADEGLLRSQWDRGMTAFGGPWALDASDAEGLRQVLAAWGDPDSESTTALARNTPFADPLR